MCEQPKSSAPVACFTHHVSPAESHCPAQALMARWRREFWPPASVPSGLLADRDAHHAGAHPHHVHDALRLRFAGEQQRRKRALKKPPEHLSRARHLREGKTTTFCHPLPTRRRGEAPLASRAALHNRIGDLHLPPAARTARCPMANRFAERRISLRLLHGPPAFRTPTRCWDERPANKPQNRWAGKFFTRRQNRPPTILQVWWGISFTDGRTESSGTNAPFALVADQCHFLKSAE